jgi:hypothetical protein
MLVGSVLALAKIGTRYGAQKRTFDKDNMIVSV